MAGLATDPSYSFFVRVTKIDEKFSSRVVKAQLFLEERRLNAADASSEQGSALAARSKPWQNYNNTKDGGKQHKNNSGDMKCYRCGVWGHVSYNCPGPKGDKTTHEKKNGEEHKNKERKEP